MRANILFVALVAATTASSAFAQTTTSRCAGCHFANMTSVPAPQHLGDWQQSPHGKRGVGCEKCHGGDSMTFQPAEAHRGVLNSNNPASPVYRANLGRTCAPCHERNAAAFGGSRHQVLVRADDARAPTCVTCHGVMLARVPSPAALESRCAACHPSDSALSDYPGVMRASVENLNAQRERADELQKSIERITDRTRRVELLASVNDARTAIKEAIAGVHTFDLRTLTERVDTAKRRLDLLTAALTPTAR
jgi:cytochrome c554/c'-like protein